jgi:hypothetical protein
LALLETITMLSLVKCCHVVALCVGFGAALLADFYVLTQGVLRPVTAQMIGSLRALSRAASIGLGLTWATGLVLVAMKFAADVHVVANEKLWAKTVIVLILSVNGLFIHRVVVPGLQCMEGRRIFDSLSLWGAAGVTFCAALSTASWTTPMVLGAAPELNFKVSFGEVGLLYGLVVLALWAGLGGVAFAVQRMPGGARRPVSEVIIQSVLVQPELIVAQPARDPLFERFEALRARARELHTLQ